MTMVHWGWLIAAGMVGAAFGALAMAILAVGAWSDRELKYLSEIQRLKDKLAEK